MRKRVIQAALAISLGLVLTGLLLWAAAMEPARAAPGVHCVNQSGTGCDAVCGGGCYGSVQAAIDAASWGNEIRIAGGTYTELLGTVAVITKELRIFGGFDQSCSNHDPVFNRTTFDARWGGSVISITSAGDVLMEFLTLTHGDGSGNCGTDGCGGGIYARDTILHVGDCVITDNVANTSGEMGRGGGIYAYTGSDGVVEIWGNRIVSNTANTNSSSQYYSTGGGIFVRYATTRLETNEILNNTGSITGSGGEGGGIYLYGVAQADLLTNTIRGNEASGHKISGGGGGIYIFGFKAYLSDNLIDDNSAAPNWAGYGGGVYVSSQTEAHLTRNTIISNAAGPAVSGFSAPGGGVHVASSQPVTLSNNLIARNTASSGGGGVHADHAWSPAGSVLMVNNTVADNVNGGVQIARNVALTLTNNVIAGHTVGVTNTWPASSTVLADTNLFSNTLDPITGANAIRKYPLLTADYRPHVGSPAIDAGRAIAWLTTDLDGNSRPQGSAYDVGAFEGDGVWWTLFLPLVLSEN